MSKIVKTQTDSATKSLFTQIRPSAKISRQGHTEEDKQDL